MSNNGKKLRPGLMAVISIRPMLGALGDELLLAGDRAGADHAYAS